MTLRYSKFLLALTIACAPLASHAQTKTLTLQVYQVCSTDGTDCAALGPSGDDFFSMATNKIWGQAGINVMYNFVGQIKNSNYLHIDDDIPTMSFASLAMGYNYQSTTVVDMFLVRTVKDSYGEGWSGVGGLVMGMDDILGYGPNGRMDTMAHELGHNFGLDPEDDPQYAGPTDPGHSNDPNQLMSSGSIRNVPGSISDINPDGLGYDQLSDYQIAVARRSSLLTNVNTTVPEPSSFVLMAAGVLGIAVTHRRRNATRKHQA